jgi:hypothetical protein
VSTGDFLIGTYGTDVISIASNGAILANATGRFVTGLRLGAAEENNWFLRRNVLTGDLTIGTYGNDVISFGTSGSAIFNGTLTSKFNHEPITKAALLATTPVATLGVHRLTDSTPAQRRVYPDGTNWRYYSDDSIVT